jgi:cyanoexosortase A
MVGSVLLVACLLRAARILHHDAVIYLLAPLEGLALALLCAPPRRLRPFAASLTCLALLPAAVVGRQLIPEEPLSLGSAGMATVLLQALGFDARVQGRVVALPGGSVSVAGVCNGTDLIMMVLTVAVIFLLAFPLRGWGPRLLVLAAAGPLAVLSNTVRIALLALIVATPWDRDRHVFDFFHEGGGSLVFAGIAVSFLGMAYLRLIDRQLRGAMEGGGNGDR